MAQGHDPEYRWERIRSPDEQWSLVDENDHVLRHIAKLGPYLGKPDPIYRVYTEAGFTDHTSLDEAMAAAEASV